MAPAAARDLVAPAANKAMAAASSWEVLGENLLLAFRAATEEAITGGDIDREGLGIGRPWALGAGRFVGRLEARCGSQGVCRRRSLGRRRGLAGGGR